MINVDQTFHALVCLSMMSGCPFLLFIDLYKFCSIACVQIMWYILADNLSDSDLNPTISH